MKKIIAILTGSSRGIGQALQKELLLKGILLITINRNSIEQSHPGHLINFPFDLSNIPEIPELVQKITIFLHKQDFESIWLIHNAATLGSIRKMTSSDVETMAETIETNLISPMSISSLLIRSLQTFSCSIRIIHISSGAAFHPIHGLGPYCISKAGMEMLSKILVLEEGHTRDFKSITISPGVVDTAMQESIRKSSKEDFSQLEHFIGFKEKGMLADANVLARKILSLLVDDLYASGDTIDITSIG